MPVYADVGPESASLGIGSRIRQQRKQCGWTLKQFADRLSLSLGRLSAIENEKAALDLDLFLAIARTLQVHVDALLPPSETRHYLVTRRSSIEANPPWPVKLVDPARETLISYHNQLWPLAQPFFDKHLEPFAIKIEPVPDDHLRFISHHHEEFFFVLRGTVEGLIRTPEGLRTETLNAGDCMYFWSYLPHCIRSTGPAAADSIHLIHSPHEPCDSELANRKTRRAVYIIDASHKNVGHQIGGRITSLRQANGMSVAEFAQLVGISVRRLNVIERGEKAVPLELLFQICRIFRKPREYFLRGTMVERPFLYVLRAAQIRREPARKSSEVASLAAVFPGSTFKALATGFPARGTEPYLITLDTRPQPAANLRPQHGQEFVYVLDGAVRLLIGTNGSEDTLFPGDSCFIDSSVPHSFVNASVHPFDKRPAEILAVFWLSAQADHAVDTAAVSPAADAGAAPVISPGVPQAELRSQPRLR